MDQNLPNTTDTSLPNPAVNPVEPSTVPVGQPSPIQSTPQIIQEPAMPQPSLETPTQQPAFATTPVMGVSTQQVFTPPIPPEQNSFSQIAPESNTTPPSNSKGLAIAAIAGGILLFVGLAVLYVFALKNNAPTPTSTSNKSAIPTVTPTPTEVITSTEEDMQTLQSLDAGDPIEDIQTIEAELNQL